CRRPSTRSGPRPLRWCSARPSFQPGSGLRLPPGPALRGPLQFLPWPPVQGKPAAVSFG
ncbi:MAG: hypothetical protein AVDCRST_MAG90-1348, partial [uncultured Microvirga sp.]